MFLEKLKKRCELLQTDLKVVEKKLLESQEKYKYFKISTEAIKKQTEALEKQLQIIKSWLEATQFIIIDFEKLSGDRNAACDQKGLKSYKST